MASTIKQRTISSVVDNRIQLSNSQCARQWSTSLGTGWTKIRVGCRISVTTTGSNLSGTPRLAIGVQVGTANLWQDAGGPTHWAGVLSNTTWTAHTGNGVQGYYLGSGLSIGKKIATTLTAGGSTGDFSLFWNSTTLRSCLFVDITKGSPNFTFNIFCFNIANGFISSDTSLATYLANVVLPSPSVTNHAMSGAITLAIDEATNGYFDSVGIAWDRTDALIEISDVCVVRLA